MSDRRCRTCRWWRSEVPCNGELTPTDADDTGLCYRHPPQQRRKGALAEYPKTTAEDWCGDHSVFKDSE